MKLRSAPLGYHTTEIPPKYHRPADDNMCPIIIDKPKPPKKRGPSKAAENGENPARSDSRTIGRWELQKRGHYRKPQGAPHPWNNTEPPAVDRVDLVPGSVRHLVKDGMPLTESGAELLNRPKRCFWCNSDAEESAVQHEGAHATWCPRYQRGPQPIVVSPASKPLYSQQTKPGVDSNRLSPKARGEGELT